MMMINPNLTAFYHSAWISAQVGLTRRSDEKQPEARFLSDRTAHYVFLLTASLSARLSISAGVCVTFAHETENLI